MTSYNEAFSKGILLLKENISSEHHSIGVGRGGGSGGGGGGGGGGKGAAPPPPPPPII